MFLLSFFMIIPSNAESLHSAVDGFFLPCIFLNIFRGSLSVFSARGRRRKERRKKENWWVLRCGESCRRLRPNECLHNLGGPDGAALPPGVPSSSSSSFPKRICNFESFFLFGVSAPGLMPVYIRLSFRC